LSRLRATHFLELSCHKILKLVGLSYPETCLIGVYTAPTVTA
jgi:hypothetical protein